MSITASTQSMPSSVVLIVDDEEEFGQALAFRLETRDIYCHCVLRGEDALSAIANRQFEVVLLDINLPGMHGLEVLKLMKKQRPNLEVLLLTSETNIQTAVQGMQYGASDYLLKPIDFELLLAAISRARQHRVERAEGLRAAETGRLLALQSIAVGFAHEINNPLQMIIQSSELLGELIDEYSDNQPLDFPLIKKTVDRMQNYTWRCASITAQLLELTSLKREKNVVTNILELIDKLLNQLQYRISTLNITIIKVYGDDIPLLDCSPTELEPALIHVIINAIDALEQQPVLRQAEQAEQAKHHGIDDFELIIKIQVKRNQKGLLIQISDTGEGIAPDILPHIYEPFFSTKLVGKGTGLGLTICHSIITALRGNIVHKALSPVGTVCCVELPEALFVS